MVALLRHAPVVRPGLLDRIGTKALGAYSCVERLSLAYRGPLLTVRRSSDNATLDVGAIPSTGKLNREQLKAFCGASSGYVTKLWDLTGNGRHCTQATTTKQPRIVSAGTIDVNAAGRPTMVFDSDDTLTRADAFGLVGSQATTVGWVCSYTTPATNFPSPWAFGGTSVTGVTLATSPASSATLMNVARGGPGYRTYTVANMTLSHHYVVLWAAGATVSNLIARQDGAAVPVSAVVGPTTTVSYQNQFATIGSFNNGASSFLNGNLNFFAIFNSVLAGTALTTLEAGMAAHA